jgi:hypothetical protein
MIETRKGNTHIRLRPAASSIERGELRSDPLIPLKIVGQGTVGDISGPITKIQALNAVAERDFMALDAPKNRPRVKRVYPVTRAFFSIHRSPSLVLASRRLYGWHKCLSMPDDLRIKH